MMSSIIVGGSAVYVSGTKSFGSILNSMIVSVNDQTGSMNWAFKLNSSFINQITNINFYNDNLYGVGFVFLPSRTDT